MVASGQRTPKFSGSLYSMLSWKGLTLTTNFTYNLGNKIRKFAIYSDILGGISSESNVRKELVDRWRVPGDEMRTNYPALISPSHPRYEEYNSHWSADRNGGIKTFASNLWNMYDNSDLRVVNGSYLRLQTLSLRYTFRQKTLRNTPFKNLSLDFSTSNVFTICSSKLDGQDPSQSGFGGTAVLSARPSYTFGVQVSF